MVNGVYFHNKAILQGGLIYKTNREVYNTANKVDTIVSGVMAYSAFKVAKNLYLGFSGQPWFPLWTGFWALSTFI